MACCCFSGDVLVTTKSGGVKRMDKLIRGEEILTLSKAGGVPQYTKFYTWIHREVDRTTEFIMIKTEAGKILKITGDHLLFGEGRVAKRAGMVKTGDKICTISPDATLIEEDVVDVSTETLTGVYAPFTMSGDFIANGFLVACYSDIDNFDVAHASMLPLRMFHKLDKSWKKENKKQEGLHIYARNLIKVWDHLPLRVQTAIQN
ncbi:desert hedgehog protein B [Folsomia candida]|uniref:Desert hedgehog protein n=1 Tax=Folsomia candida TaxID=158441 RepID=A0A226D5T3_FOLCA|nr:desert hedgehog protein B [Folsomia candida]XP_021965652.1 desert hedgehog protein B [Folsomia candida]OXA40234.1 Desert hedgehog protein [Folsomia candida]OXA40318.1 Desert hedgehog protein [Folsomia candida]